jgi:hypothetical protein
LPGEPGNERDPLYRADLTLRRTGGEGRFDFVIEA